MKKHHWNGSLITATRQPPSSSAANGVFNLVSQQVYKSASKWPAFSDLVHGIIGSGLDLFLDASNSSSYSGTGTTWSDLSANNNDATLTNGPAFSTTNGGLFNFDGVDDYADCGNILNLTAYTKSVWFRPEDGNGTNLMSGASGHAFWMAQVSNKIAAGHLGDYQRVVYQRPSGDFLNLWWNATVTYDNSTGFALYLNGYLVDSDTSTPAVGSSDTKVNLGRYSTSNYFDGDIGSAMLYDRALSATEVLQNFNALKSRFGYGSIVSTDLILHLDAGDLNSYTGTGTTWTDLSGNNNDATLVNGIGYNGANYGALVFDGTNDHVREDTVLDTLTATSDTWSIECWFNTDINPNVVECMIAVNYNNGEENTLLLGVVNNSGCKLAVYYSHSIISENTAVTVGQWHHVVATHASGGLKVYLDGIQITSNSSTVNRALSDCAFLIGAELDSGSSFGNYFDGKISSTLVYSKTLTASEVLQNYDAIKNRYGHKSVVTEGLALHLDAAHPDSYSGSGTTWYDLTSNDLDFALTNGPVYSSNVGYFTFDGTNDKAEISSGWTSFDSDPFTIEIWYRYHTAAAFEGILATQSTSFQVDFSNTAGRIRLRVESQSDIVSSSATEGANTWKQVVLVREGTGTNQFKIYLNGSLDTTTTLSTNFNNDDQLRIACNRGNNAFYDGDISVVRIYKNKGLTSSEVTQNYDAVKGRYGLS